MEKEVVKELIQDELNTKNLKIELKKIIEGKDRDLILENYQLLESKLGGSGASAQTAELIVTALKK